MNASVLWLEATSLSKAINAYPWLWPACETLHFIGLTLLVGIAGAFDLRLMGLMRRVPIPVIKEFMPWAILGFAVNLVTGTIFFIGVPHQYVNNPAFWAKVAFLMVAGVNAMVFETTIGDRIATIDPDADTPLSFKIIGGVSLFSWLAVLFFGRMLPFLGDTF
jgi:hypothetical protein